MLSEADFDAYPLWRYDERDDLYHPILSMDEIPEDNRDMFIRAKFYSPNKMIFKGYVNNILKVFCVNFFWNNKIYFFNKNAPDWCLEQFYKLAETLQTEKNKIIVIPDIFPVKYETAIDLEGYRNVSGEFNAFEKLKDQRLLRWKEI